MYCLTDKVPGSVCIVSSTAHRPIASLLFTILQS